MPRRSKYNIPPAAGASVTSVPESEATSEPIRPQITQMSGFKNIDEVIDAAPETTQTERPRGPNGRLLRKDGTERARKQPRGSSQRSSQPEDDLMSDPKYREAIAGMSFYRVPSVMKRGFKTVSVMTADPSIDLNEEETAQIDGYFYAVGKHTSFDPMATIVGRVIMLVLLLGEIIGVRILERSGLGKQLKELLTREPETSTMQDNGVVRTSGEREDVFSTAVDAGPESDLHL